MREIKFRAWDGEKMISPDYIDRNGKAHWKENSIPESTNVVMQFTGLYDRQGKEIYEGDIIRIDSVVKTQNHTDGVVEYEQQACAFWIKWSEQSEGRIINRYKELNANGGGDHYSNDNFEVIGNIYEHSELLK